MVELILFVVATLVALFLFDQYEREIQEHTQLRDSVFLDSRNEDYYNTSLFAVLGISRDEVRTFSAFRDRFRSYTEVSAALRQAGLEHVRLIVGIDFTASNEWQGRRSFKSECLHAIRGSAVYNPYQRVLQALGQTLQPLLQGFPIPAFGFGDTRTKAFDVFPLKESGAPCLDFAELQETYTQVAQRVELSGPTSLAPILWRAAEIVQRSRAFHVLLIVTDGRIRENDLASQQALVRASRCALSVVAVGVGDGPWQSLEDWDDRLTERCFDNFQFVSFHQVVRTTRNPEAALALHALMEVPDQYRTVLKLGFLSSSGSSGSQHSS